MGYFHIPNAPSPAFRQCGTGRIFLPPVCIIAHAVSRHKKTADGTSATDRCRFGCPATLALAATTVARHRRCRRGPCSWVAYQEGLYSPAVSRHKKTPLPPSRQEGRVLSYSLLRFASIAAASALVQPLVGMSFPAPPTTPRSTAHAMD